MLLFGALSAGADPVPVTHMEGEVHAFLTLHDDAGKLLGYADEVNVKVGRAWRSRFTVRFLDGSLMDETAVYTQSPTLHLLSDHLVQRGPSFPKPVDLGIDTATGQVTCLERKDGKDERHADAMNLPADLANGLLPMLFQNVPHGTQAVTVGYIACTPRPRLVKLAIRANGQGKYHIGSTSRAASQIRMHIDIGGIEGLLAPLAGKEPPDTDAWVSSGDAPTFLKMHGILYLGGPQWTLQLASPQW